MTGSYSTRVAAALGVVVLLASAGFLVAGVSASTANSILPWMQGRDAAHERALSRDSVALAVHTGLFNGEDGVEPLSGVDVAVAKRSATDAAPDAAHAGTTDDGGRVVFDLAPGRYVLIVSYEGTTASHNVDLMRDTRVGAVFTPDGDVRFFDMKRQDAIRHGQTYVLMVYVGSQTDDRERAPLADVQVVIERIVRDSDRDGTSTEPAGRGLTNERGVAEFRLRQGPYRVTVETADGSVGHARLVLDSNAGIGFLQKEDGSFMVRMQNRDHAPGDQDRPSDRPDRPTERDRPTTDRGYGLGIHVVVGGDRADGRSVPGAHVVVYKMTDDGRHAVARGATDDNGTIALRLAPGGYVIEAEHGEYSGHARVQLDGDKRVQVAMTAA